MLRWVYTIFNRKKFSDHFHMDHEFHGVKQHCIHETYCIRPKTDLSQQMLLDGVQIHSVRLHQRSQIKIQPDVVKICLQVPDPQEAKHVIGEVKKCLTKQLTQFEKRFYSNPLIQYVEQFCEQCEHYRSKPLNQCIQDCHYTPKGKEEPKRL